MYHLSLSCDEAFSLSFGRADFSSVLFGWDVGTWVIGVLTTVSRGFSFLWGKLMFWFPVVPAVLTPPSLSTILLQSRKRGKCLLSLFFFFEGRAGVSGFLV
eukprot:RCo018232